MNRIHIFVSVHLTGRTNHSEVLIDLVGLDVQSVSPPQQPSSSLPADLLCGSAGPDAQSPSPGAPSAALSLLDEELLSLGNDMTHDELLSLGNDMTHGDPVFTCCYDVFLTHVFMFRPQRSCSCSD